MTLALPLLPALAAAATLALRGRPRVLGPLAVGALLATLALTAWAAAAEPASGWRWSPQLRLELAVSDFGRVMVLLVPAIAAPIVAYAAATETEGRARLLALMLAFVGAMLFLVVAADFLTLLIGWELVGAASWALIGHGWQDSDNASAARQSFITTRLGDLGLYVAAGLTFAAGGSFAFTALGDLDRPMLDSVAAGVLLAAMAKSAQVPFSPWLFAAMAGPTPVSALLHSATLVAAGAYLLIRLAPMLEPAGWFLPAVAGIGLATALSGGAVAALQPHAKRTLAGSTSAQYGLMFVAVGAGSTAAAGAHLVAHAAFKSLLFLGAGVALHAAGTGELAGQRLGRTFPLVALLSGIGALALAAAPPLGGAWTKEQIVAAASHRSGWLAAGVLVAGFLSALYAARYQLLAFGPGEARPSRAHAYRPGQPELWAMAALAVITVALSALWIPGLDGAVERATKGRLAAGAIWELAAAVATIGAAFGLAWWLWRGARLTTFGLSAPRQEAAADWLGLPRATRVVAVEPVLAMSRLLSAFDNRVVDAGVRGMAALSGFASRFLARRGEWTIDRAVRAVALATMRSAAGSRRADDGGIDRAVEGGAAGVGIAGRESRRLQTGLAHHYYVVTAAGLAAMVAVLALTLGN